MMWWSGLTERTRTASPPRALPVRCSGKADSPTPDVNLSTLDGVNGFEITGIAANERLGFAVSNAGDVNGDGFRI